MSKRVDEVVRKINQEIESLAGDIEASEDRVSELVFELEKSHLDLIMTLDANISQDFQKLNINASQILQEV